MIGLQCLTCARRHDIGTSQGRAACDAYPDGIPWEIVDGRIDHRQAHAGDRGLRYAPLPGTDTSEMDEPALAEIESGPADPPLI